jgi:hypothetical protein
MISLEALLLRETNARDRGEMRFRLSSRIAWLLGSNRDERASLARRARDLYDLRSTLVHGGEPDLDIRALCERASELGDLCRKCIKVWIDRRIDGKPVDLASLGLGE